MTEPKSLMLQRMTSGEWYPAWRDSVGIPALDPLYVPQSTTLLLALLALVAAPLRVRCG